MKDKVTQYDLLEEKIRSRDENLILQAKEYERRLEGLNHENDRIMEVLKQSIPREIFDRVIESMNAKIQLNTDYKNAMEAKGKLEKYIPWLIAASAVAIALFKK